MNINRRQLLKTGVSIAATATIGAAALRATARPLIDLVTGRPIKLIHRPTRHNFDEIRAFAQNPEVRLYVEERKEAILESPELSYLDVSTEWLRSILEDMIVLDNVAILRSTTIYHKDARSWVQLNVDCIDRLARLEDGEPGSTYTVPSPPASAYIQRWNGRPTVHFTSDQLLYTSRNRPDCTYGYSEVERWMDARESDFYFVRFGEQAQLRGDIQWTISLVEELIG